MDQGQDQVDCGSRTMFYTPCHVFYPTHSSQTTEAIGGGIRVFGASFRQIDFGNRCSRFSRTIGLHLKKLQWNRDRPRSNTESSSSCCRIQFIVLQNPVHRASESSSSCCRIQFIVLQNPVHRASFCRPHRSSFSFTSFCRKPWSWSWRITYKKRINLASIPTHQLPSSTVAQLQHGIAQLQHTTSLKAFLAHIVLFLVNNLGFFCIHTTTNPT